METLAGLIVGGSVIFIVLVGAVIWRRKRWPRTFAVKREFDLFERE